MSAALVSRKRRLSDPDDSLAKRQVHIKDELDSSTNGSRNGTTKTNLKARSDVAPWDKIPEALRVPPAQLYADLTPQYSCGAIISMRLVNFQVATDSTFHFGPFLNLVLGSNGTGKSTIVNAIYLLFRGKLKHLDRKSYEDFIQYGKSQAFVSAQIKGRGNQLNPLFMMKLQRSQPQKPEWFINGEHAAVHTADEFVSEYNIQVDNLCQFLPQFRVAAFSAESPQHRMLSTERAIGYPEMVDDHQLLANTGHELSELSVDVEKLRQSVEKFRERSTELNEKLKEIELANKDKDRAKMLEKVLEIAKYLAFQTEKEKLEGQLAEARARLATFDTQTQAKKQLVDEAGQRVEELQRHVDEIKSGILESENIYKSFERKLRDHRETASDMHERVKNIKADLETEMKRVQEFSSEQQEAELDVKQVQKELDDLGNDPVKYEELRAQARSLEDTYTHTEANERSSKSEQSAVERSIKQVSVEFAQNTQRLEYLKSMTTSARPASEIRDLLRGDNGNLERSVAFVEQHQHMFEKPVILPALLTLNITDQRLLPVFLEVLSLVNAQKYVCQTARDQQLLTELAARNGGLDVKTTYVSPATSDKDADGLNPQTLAKLKSMGFQGVLTDKLDGPEPMIRFMKSLGLGRVPYAHSQIRYEHRETLKNSSQGTFQFADNSTFYRIQRSRYGQRLPTEMIAHLNRNTPAWLNFMLRKDNSAEIGKLEAQLKGAQEKSKSLKSRREQLIIQSERLAEKLNEARDELRKVKVQLKTEQALRERLALYTRRREDTAARLKAAKKRRHHLRGELSASLLGLNKALASVSSTVNSLPANTLTKLQTNYYLQTTQETLLKDAKQQYTFLKNALSKQREQLKTECERLVQEIRKTEERQRHSHDNYEASVSWLRSHKKLKEGMNLAKKTPVAELDDEVTRLNAMVNLHQQGTDTRASVQHQLEVTAAQLNEDERMLSLKETQLNSLIEDTRLKRERWELALNKLIPQVSSNFTEMFSKLGCRGNVTLDKPDTLAVGTWGIDINLAFRQEEQTLSKLSKFRQSGGERAVSTAMYLLALQETSVAPFRVLDEINQGMDEKNERATMKFFVDKVCNSDDDGLKPQHAQQTFLITPKLVSNIPTHSRMNIVFIFGGSAVGNTDKLIPPTRPEQTRQQLEDEIDSENENEDEKEVIEIF